MDQGVLLAALSAVLGASCTLASGGALFYMFVCYSGVYDAANMDAEIPHHQPSLLTSNPVLNDVLLLFIFFSLHSLLARDWPKRLLSPFLSPASYRQLYFIISAATLFMVPYCWSPLPRVLWHVDTPLLRYSLHGFSICGLVLTSVAFFSVNPLEFCGMHDSVQALMGTRRQQEVDELVVNGVYGMVRHPMYTGIFMMLWSQPTMTQGRVLLAVFSTLYVFLAVSCLEEPALIRQFGHKYRDYMNTTGMFFPHLLNRHNNKLE